jgi:uncharacterized secreted protein with C-terminal beta-propeller domain
LLTVLTIDPEDGLASVDTDTVMSGGEIVYASPTSLYVATQRFVEGDAREGASAASRTQLHRFAASEPGRTEYSASGHVRGSMLSQWSMSEHDGALRVASTTGEFSRRRSKSHVTVLREVGARLIRVGHVGDLGRGEQIQAVRFIGDLALVVTFRQIDPLYTLDLSSPTDPQVLGELEVPGYSAYLHPLGDEHLIGVGQDATRRGRTRGSQASLFDLSNLTAPSLVDTRKLGSPASSSEVEFDHRAFLYNDTLELGVVPLEVFRRRDPFYGAVALRVRPTGIKTIGRIAHGRSYRGKILRSLVVEDRLFTLSERGLASHDPVTLQQLGWTSFR